MSETKFETWGIVELFGHTTIAGYLTEENIAGSNMLRVDVPAVAGGQEFTKYYGSSAIYGLTPTDEQTARAYAASLRVTPHNCWTIDSVIKEKAQQMLAAQTVDDGQDHDIPI